MFNMGLRPKPRGTPRENDYIFAGSLVLALAACASAPAPAPARPTVAVAAAPAHAATPTPTPAPAAAPPSPSGALSIAEARRYMLTLINRDRATANLPPVELDEGPPTVAGQAHAEDMVHLGYLGHWGSDGSVPEQRHTEAGGVDMVLENALCFTDEKVRDVDAGARITKAEIERAEGMFFNEVPPNDGHRKNILKPLHTKVGIGVAQSKETARELAVPCFAQEFTDGYGTYAALPKTAKVGQTIHVEGKLKDGLRPSGVGLARVVLPKPITPAELNKRRTYPVPKPYQMYWGPGFVTPIRANITGTAIAIDVSLSDQKQPGLYEVSVWARLPGSEEHTMVGLRTIRVE